MHWIDWSIVGVYLVWIVWDGIRLSRGTHEVEGYFLANRTLPWWAVGLSVMATQMSAITLVGTTGQGYADGIRFVQFYFGLPLAMVILSLTVVPFFHRARVFTAYEYLERRFGVVTRSLTSFLFLVSRGMSCGVIIAAPAVILSVVLGWDLTLTILAIGIPTVFYTMKGGVQAVTWTDVKQMVVIVAGLGSAVAVLIWSLPESVDLGSALHVAGSVGKLQAIDFRFDLNETYTFWSGMIGGLFLMLSYFGCDQSQLQRYLTAKSVDQARQSLLMSAYWKVPLQALILLTGVLVFVFFLFRPAPMLFNPVHASAVAASPRAGEYEALEVEYERAFEARRAAAEDMARAEAVGSASAAEREAFAASDASVRDVRARATDLVKSVTGDESYRDVNYVFPTFVTEHMPIGLIGLLVAAIFAAAMSSIAAELNSLSTATVIDFYRRLIKPEADDAHYLFVSKVATGFWGAFACVVAVYAVNLGSLIEVVNRFGSFFYGSLLGVFILALGFKRANGIGASVGLAAGMIAVGFVALHPATASISFLWHNVVGAVVVTVVGLIVSMATGGARMERP
ncbi:MAG TPA: sodium:solute symporter [Vicinamibacterales bacterium]|nr:sodium:solute symporter [Vicinamibacterales bacterium]